MPDYGVWPRDPADESCPYPLPLFNGHDFESKTVGYLPQSEPKWVTEFGYRPPIIRYTCKKCGYSTTDRGRSSEFFLLYLCPESLSSCPGRVLEEAST